MKAMQRCFCLALALVLSLACISCAYAQTEKVSCPTCGGRGSVNGATCSLCGGSGSILMSGSRDGRDRANDITGTQPNTSYKSVLINASYLSMHLFTDGSRTTMYQKLRALDENTLVHLRATRDPDIYQTLTLVSTAEALAQLLGEGVNGLHISLDDSFSAEDYKRTRDLLEASLDPLSFMHLMFASGENCAFIFTNRELTDAGESALAAQLDAWFLQNGAQLGQSLPESFKDVLFAVARRPLDVEEAPGVVLGSALIDGLSFQGGNPATEWLSLHLYGEEPTALNAYSLGVQQSEARFTVTHYRAADAEYFCLARK